MIKIKKSKAGWRVQYVGKNGEILAVSEVLETRGAARNNIKATAKLFGIGTPCVIWYRNEVDRLRSILL